MPSRTAFADGSSPYQCSHERVAASNGMTLVRIGGGLHPSIQCYVEDEEDDIKPYREPQTSCEMKSTASRNERMNSVKRAMERKEDQLSRQNSGEVSPSPYNSHNEPAEKPQASKRLYTSPQHLRGPYRGPRSCRSVPLNAVTDELQELLCIMNDKNREPCKQKRLKERASR